MNDRLARASTGAEKRCRFCRGAIPPDPRKEGVKRLFEKSFCGKVCRSKFNTRKFLNNNYKGDE